MNIRGQTRMISLIIVLSLWAFCLNDNLATANFQSRELALDTFDLDVTYIERIPRYPRNLDCYIQTPLLEYPCSSPMKRWPDAGENVSFIAHIQNKGTQVIAQFSYSWYVDNALQKQGVHTWVSGSDQQEIFDWQWMSGRHTIKFLITSPVDLVSTNNSLEDATDAYSYSIFVEKGQYDAFEKRLNLAGSYSYEDWLQAQFTAFNNTFQTAIFQSTPNGILSRVRVDKIIVSTEMDAPTQNAFTSDPQEFWNDGRWLFSDGDPTNARGDGGSYDAYASDTINTIDWALIHELSHMIGRFDMYNIDFYPGHNQITGPNGLPLNIGHWSKYSQDIMQSPGAGIWSEYSAISFNRDYLDRAGLFGEYLYDLPSQNTLLIIDSNKNPVAGAHLKVYHDVNDSLTDASLILSGTTNYEGKFELGANPFYPLNCTGTNAALFISITVPSGTEYHWLEATDFNMAFWYGYADHATYTITLGLPDNLDVSLPPKLPADTVFPTTQLVTPHEGDTISGMTSFSVIATDNRGVKRVEIVIDGKPLIVIPRYPYTIKWNTSLIGDGQHKIWVRAFDTAYPSNVTETQPITVMFRNSTNAIFSWDYESIDDIEAWKIPTPENLLPSASNSTLRIPLWNGDPSMGRWLPFGFATNKYQKVLVRMRVTGGGDGVGQFYWTTYDDIQEDEQKVIYFPVKGDNDWHEYIIDVGEHTFWKGRIRRIRLDPVHSDQYIGNEADIDWIRIINEPMIFPEQMIDLPFVRR